MRPTPFDVKAELAPIPFDPQVCAAPRPLKDAGLPWLPNAGCLVRDPDDLIEPAAPIPNNVYFIVNLGHFFRRSGTTYDIAQSLECLPQPHQLHKLCEALGIKSKGVVPIPLLNDPNGLEALIAQYDPVERQLESVDNRARFHSAFVEVE